jgi:hypothetical protein
MSDESTLIAEPTWSVAKRAKRSADLCFGGVAGKYLGMVHISVDTDFCRVSIQH